MHTFAVEMKENMMKTKRLYALLLPLVVLLTCLLTGCNHAAEQEETDEVATDTIETMVKQVQLCARLYTTEYKIHKIVTYDDVVRLKGNMLNKKFDIPLPLGDRKIAIPMDATLKAYIDFSTFSEKNIERDGQKITILLPDPEVTLTSSKINQRDIKEYVGLVRSHFTDKEMTEYERQGRQSILKNIKMTDIVERSRQSAARILIPMLTQLGWQEQDITIAFRKELNPNTLVNTDIER